MAARVDQFAEAIGMTTERTASQTRAVASVMMLGFFARLLSVVVGAAVTGELTVAADPDAVWVGPGSGTVAAIGTDQPWVGADPLAAIQALALPLADLAADQFGLPDSILLGNIAAAVVGACEVVAAIDPRLSPMASRWRHRLLTTGPLAGTSSSVDPFVRTSCCLNHRLPMDCICGNCPLVTHQTPTARRLQGRMAQSAGG